MQKNPDYWQQACRELSAADPVMAQIIGRYEGETLRGRGDAFYTLARSIVGQQISVKAADAVWGKLESRVGSRECCLHRVSETSAALSLEERGSRVEGISPQAILSSGDEELRQCGLSRQKVLYLREIAAYCLEKGVTRGHFDDLDDESVIKELVSIKGVGRWTAEMFLIFHLMRPDVFPIDDIGVQKGIERHYLHVIPVAQAHRDPDTGAAELAGMTKREKLAAMVELAEMWQPWRSVATWYLWRSLDPVPVAY